MVEAKVVPRLSEATSIVPQTVEAMAKRGGKAGRSHSFSYVSGEVVGRGVSSGLELADRWQRIAASSQPPRYSITEGESQILYIRENYASEWS